MPVTLAPGTTLSDVLKILDRKQGAGAADVVLEPAAGGRQLAVSLRSPAMTPEQRSALMAELKKLVIAEMTQAGRWAGKDAALKKLAYDAVGKVWTADSSVPLTVDDLRRLSANLRPDGVPASRQPEAASPGARAALHDVLPPSLAARALAPVVTPGPRPWAERRQSPESLPARSVPGRVRRDGHGTIVPQLLANHRFAMGKMEQAARSLGGDCALCDEAIDAVNDSACSLDAQWTRPGSLYGDSLVNLTRVLVMLPAERLADVRLSGKLLDEVSLLFGAMRSAVADVAHRLPDTSLLLALRDELASLNGPASHADRVLRQLRPTDASDGKRAAPVARQEVDPGGASPQAEAAPIVNLAMMLDAAASAPAQAADDADRLRTQRVASETIGQYLVDYGRLASGPRGVLRQRFHETCRQLAEHPDLADSAAWQLETHIEVIQAMSDESARQEALTRLAEVFRHVPASAWTDTFLSRESMKLLSDACGSLKRSQRSSDNVVAGLSRLETNAGRFERFLGTDLALDSQFDSVDRAILIDLSEAAARPDDGKGDSSMEDAVPDGKAAAFAAAIDLASGVDGAAAATSRSASGEAGGSGRSAAADAALAAPVPRSQPASAAGPKDSKLMRPPELGPNRNREFAPPGRPKPSGSHHDASKARWRSRGQRDMYRRKGKSGNHRQAVAAMRAYLRACRAAVRS